MTIPPYPPIEPPPSPAELPDPRLLSGPEEVVALSRTLSPGLVLQAYRKGIFPWPVSQGVVPWVCPDPRAIFPLERTAAWPRSVRRALRAPGLRASADEAFAEVLAACAQARAEGTWITPDIAATYLELHRLGWAHSVEVWESGALVGGLYGLAVGAVFAGESMFHRKSGASKVAFAATAERLRRGGFAVFDVQVHTDHLASLGCTTVPRALYLDTVRDSIGREARFLPD